MLDLKPNLVNSNPAQNVEVYQHLQWLIQQAYQIVGITPNSSFRTKNLTELIQTLQLEPFKISNLHVLQWLHCAGRNGS